MSNKFEVLNMRYKLDDFHMLLVEGWFHKNQIGDTGIEFYIDDIKIPSEMERHSSTYVVGKNLSKKSIIDTLYFFWLELPADYNKGKKLIIERIEKGKKHKVAEFNISDIVKMKKGIAGSIDFSGFEKEKAILRGWIASPESAKLSVSTLGGNELEISLRQKNRGDVQFEFPEISKENVLGFEIEIEECKEKKVRFIVSYGEKKYKRVCSLSYSKLGKVAVKAKKWTVKGLAYYRSRGLKDTFIRIYEKITKQSDIDYGHWKRMHDITEDELKEQKGTCFEYSPKISIVVPLFKTPEKYLKELIDSVKNQTYENWELCFSDGTGENTNLRQVVENYQKNDSRIKMVCSDVPLQISENTNLALGIAEGEFLAFADHDDLLCPNALFENVSILNKNPEIDLIYSDEDKISMDGKQYFGPHFKPDFNIDLLRTVNYICHFVIVRKAILEKAGKFNPALDGAQDYDFILRCIEQTDKIYHIPMVLYHWRAHPDSTAENPESKMYAFEAGAKAIKAHYERTGIDANVLLQKSMLGIYRSKYHINTKPLVSIIIPNKDHTEDLNKCISSIEEKSSYKNIEYIIIENNSILEKTFDYYEKLQRENKKVKVVKWEKEFNYSAINNFGVKFAKGQYFLFLNNDTEIINESCIEEMLGYCMRDDVGIVGSRLYYPDNTIQHAGVIIGIGGVAGHCFINLPKDQLGYFARAYCAQDYSAVTAACMMVKKSVFEDVNGFDEKLKVAFNDIDFCLRVRETGKLVVYNPYAELYHYESKSRGLEDTEEKQRRFRGEVEFMQRRWHEVLEAGDPYYNPNLTLMKSDFSLR